MNDQTNTPATEGAAEFTKANPVKAAKKPAPKGKTAKKAAPVKKPAKKASAKKSNGSTESSTQALVVARAQYVVDTKTKTAGGNPSIHNGDKVAKMLLGKDLDAVYKEAAKILKEPESGLRAKYKHLNVGMQRMNLGNRIRAAV